MLGWRWVVACVALGIIFLGCQNAGELVYNPTHDPLPADQPPVYLGKIVTGNGSPDRAYPKSLAVREDQLYVTYDGEDTGDIYSLDGELVGSFNIGIPGTRPDPAGIAFDDQGRRYVADGKAGMVLVYDNDGQFIHRLPARLQSGNAPVPVIDEPGGVAVEQSAVYISDKSNGTVNVIDINTLEPIVSFWGGSEDETRLGLPLGIVVTDDGRVLVADAGKGTVEVFSCDGRYAYRFSGDNLIYPSAIAIDNEPPAKFAPGRIHVVDGAQGKVYVYDYFGEPLFSYGDIGEGSGVSGQPASIAISHEERLIFLADGLSHEINVYGY
jgi:hypothetical protein